MSTIAPDQTWTWNERRMLDAVNARHGIVSPPEFIQRSHADIPSIFHVGVPIPASSSVKSASGGVGHTQKTAALAAIGEAMERYSAASAKMEMRRRCEIEGRVFNAEDFSLFSTEQRHSSNFQAAHLYSDDCEYVEVKDETDVKPAWIPASLVLLRDVPGEPVGTSNGLAAGPSPTAALLRAIQEVVERDALMAVWQHSLSAPIVEIDAKYHEEFAARGGNVTCFNFTPSYSPHYVAAVAAGLPVSGEPRFSLGVACRQQWEEAVDKAWLECVQGLLFAGWYTSQPEMEKIADPTQVTSFEQHAAFYTWNPSFWEQLPLFGGANVAAPRSKPPAVSRAGELRTLIDVLSQNGIRIFSRDVTTPDLSQVGMHVMRAASPQLIPLHCHEQFPFLGGTAENVTWRFPWAAGQERQFPNPLPHPLG